MIEPEQVPYDAMRAGLQAWVGSEGTIMSAMERAIAAALSAWPGMIQIRHPRDSQHAIILPLLVEHSNAEG